MNDYEKDIVVDENNLKKEWEKQPGLFLHYSLQLAEAEKEKNKAKEQLELDKAEIDKAIRHEPGVFGISKITESVITNTIIIQKSYMKLNQDYINKIYDLSVLVGVIKAFDHKKKALENLVQLHIAGYNAEPKSKRRLT